MQIDFCLLFKFFRGIKQQVEINLGLQAITYVAMNFHLDHTSYNSQELFTVLDTPWFLYASELLGVLGVSTQSPHHLGHP